MATLLPTLSSDDEGPLNLRGGDDERDDDASASSRDVEMDQSFTFGGILGEDGGLFSSKTTPIPAGGWSYSQVLQNLEKQMADKSSGVAVPLRMDVASLIAAKRQTIVSAANNTNDRGQKKLKSDVVVVEKKQVMDYESNSDDDVVESSSHSSSRSNSRSEDEESVVDKNERSDHHQMEQDVLKTRAGSTKKDKDDHEEDVLSSSSSTSNSDDGQEAAKAAAFFDDNQQRSQSDEIEIFSQLTLSRPLLRGIAAMGFVKPTPIQAAVIPLALAGRDICGSAVTGSGKTAAFLLPLFQRLLHRHHGGGGSSIKAVILAPTRELAAQCMAFTTTLAQYTKLRACLIVGGSKNGTAQQAELRARPDLVIATPGRLLDHVLNSPGVSLEGVEFLVLDEADRLLDLGFQEEVHELIKHCPVERQTMLFSATMNTKVDDLIHLSLKRPVRVRISNTDKESRSSSSSKDIEVAPRLDQEFVRVRAGNEGVNREGMLLALLTRTFTKQTIVFFDTKAAAHRLMIICGLCGIKCTELHGNLTQQQRLLALDDFKGGEVDVLLASDLACRGLDIDSVKTVINFEMPSSIETYVHRIGRTARAGRGGRSCTLIGEGRRHLMKELIKDAETKNKRNGSNNKPKSSADSGVIRSRVIPPAVVSHFVDTIKSLEQHIDEVMQAEAVARMDRLAEMEAIKAQNIIEHSDEIQSRPQKEWFMSNKQKELTKKTAAEKQKLIEEKAGTGTHRMTRKKRRAREALQALNAPSNSSTQEEQQEEDDAPRKQVSIKADARKTKREEAAREHEAADKSIHDLDRERAARKTKKRKGANGTHAAGDGSLFDEDKVAFSLRKPKAKESESVAKSSFQFQGYDPTKKLGKKRGNKSFKSKSKYKRRK